MLQARVLALQMKNEVSSTLATGQSCSIDGCMLPVWWCQVLWQAIKLSQATGHIRQNPSYAAKCMSDAVQRRMSLGRLVILTSKQG